MSDDRVDRRAGVSPPELDPELAELIGDDDLGDPQHPLPDVIEDNAKTGSRRAQDRFVASLLEPLKEFESEEDYVIKFGDRKVRRCKAVYKSTGNRCGRSAMKGQAVCNRHGGANPNSKRTAQIRLATLVDPAIGRLARILVNGTDRDALRAIENVLDRTGFPRRTEVSDVNEAKDMLVHYLKEARDNASQLTDGSAKIVVDDTEHDTEHDADAVYSDYDDSDDDDYDEPGSSVIEVQGTFNDDRDEDGDAQD